LAAEIAALDPAEARVVASAFSLYFDLVNGAEEYHRVKALRQQEQENYPKPVKESVGEAVARLKDAGVTPQQMAALLETLDIELVLTAHPTEARRRTILSKLDRIAILLREYGAPDRLPHEQQASLAALHAEVTAFWLTERARTARPTVTDEVRTNLYFIDRVFWEVLPRLYADLETALEEHYPSETPSSVQCETPSSVQCETPSSAPGCVWLPGWAATGTATPTSPPWLRLKPCACIAAWQSRNIARRCKNWPASSA
jgi:phosphoenolpyruvate carboxylase